LPIAPQPFWRHLFPGMHRHPHRTRRLTAQDCGDTEEKNQYRDESRDDPEMH
jgi:hypothetical protein